MREQNVEKDLVQKVEALGGLCWKFLSPSTNGVPDRVVLYKGGVYFVELKAPGERPRADQVQTHREMADRGIPVYVSDSVEANDRFITDVLGEAVPERKSSGTGTLRRGLFF